MSKYIECNVEYITTNKTTNVVADKRNVFVHAINFPKNTTGTVTLQSVADTPVTYFAFPASTVAGTYILDVEVSNGLAVVTSAADVTIVSYQVS